MTRLQRPLVVVFVTILVEAAAWRVEVVEGEVQSVHSEEAFVAVLCRGDFTVQWLMFSVVLVVVCTVVLHWC